MSVHAPFLPNAPQFLSIVAALDCRVRLQLQWCSGVALQRSVRVLCSTAALARPSRPGTVQSTPSFTSSARPRSFLRRWWVRVMAGSCAPCWAVWPPVTAGETDWFGSPTAGPAAAPAVMRAAAQHATATGAVRWRPG